MKSETRYTLNRDGTVEKWYLEKDCGNQVYLRKTCTPKFNCGMKAFPANEVYLNYIGARRALRNEAAQAGEGEK